MISESLSLFENNDGTCFLLKESYVELRSQTGEVEFVELLSQETPFTNKKSNIRALDPTIWRSRHGK